MEHSSDTDLSSSEDSFQSCPDETGDQLQLACSACSRAEVSEKDGMAISEETRRDLHQSLSTTTPSGAGRGDIHSVEGGGGRIQSVLQLFDPLRRPSTTTGEWAGEESVDGGRSQLESVSVLPPSTTSITGDGVGEEGGDGGGGGDMPRLQLPTTSTTAGEGTGEESVEGLGEIMSASALHLTDITVGIRERAGIYGFEDDSESLYAWAPLLSDPLSLSHYAERSRDEKVETVRESKPLKQHLHASREECLEEERNKDAEPMAVLDESHPLNREGALKGDKIRGHGDSDALSTGQAAELNIPASQFNTACICKSLIQVLHDGCRARKEMETSADQGKLQTLLDHYDFVQISLDSLQHEFRTSQHHECPVHGLMPQRVVQSKCDHCLSETDSSPLDVVEGGSTGEYGETDPYALLVAEGGSTGEHGETDLYTVAEGGSAGEIDTQAIGGDTVGTSGEDEATADLSSRGQHADDGMRHAGSTKDDLSIEDHSGNNEGDVLSREGHAQNNEADALRSEVHSRNNAGDDLSSEGHSWNNEEGVLRSKGNAWNNEEGADNYKSDTVHSADGGATGGVDTGGVGGGGSAGVLSPEEKETRKVLNKASKKLLKLNRRIQAFQEDRASQEKYMQEKMELMEANRAEAMKSLREHVSHLHAVLDRYHDQQQEMLTQRHRGVLQQALVTRTQGLNLEAGVTDVQKHVEERLTRIHKHHDVTAADTNDITALTEIYNSYTNTQPPTQVSTLTYTVDIPQVTLDEVQSLLGYFVITERDQDDTLTPQPSYLSPDPPRSRRGAHSAAPVPKPGPPPHSERAAKSHETETQHVRCRPSVSPATSSERALGRQGGAGPTQQPLSQQSISSATSSDRSGSGRQSGESAKSSPPKSRTQARNSSSSGLSSSDRQPEPPSAGTPRSFAAVASEGKLSETMASTTSLTSSVGSQSASKAAKRARIRARRKKKQRAAEAEGGDPEPPKPVAITTLNERGHPKKFKGCGKEPRAFAARPAGEVWVVYGVRNPNLDLLNETGDVLESTRIGGNAMGAASFSEDNVLVCSHSPCCQLQLLDSEKEAREVVKLPLTPTGVGVGSTGIAVSGHKALYWIPLDGGENEWVVKEKGSPLKNACSCDVFVLQEREIICLADDEGHRVWFFEKLNNDEFAPRPLFTYAAHKDREGKAVPFTPVSVSALAGTSFVAVLDASSSSVLIVDVEKNEAVSVLAKRQLCDGVPSVIAFALTARDEEPKLWVGSSTGCVYLVSLAFQY